MRFEIVSPTEKVAYGFDTTTGVFLSVYDARLQHREGESKAVNAIAAKIGAGDGVGAILDLHTGTVGFGKRVDHGTMARFLKRYGVSCRQIDLLPLVFERADDHKAGIVPSLACDLCSNYGGMWCDRCKKANYCSRECQLKDWPLHKMFCRMLNKLDAPADGGRSVTGLLLPQSEKRPKLVKLPLIWKLGDVYEQGFWSIDTSAYIKGFVGRFRSENFPGQDYRLKYGYRILYKDGFMEDHMSKDNTCVKNLLTAVTRSVYGDQWDKFLPGNIVPTYWRNDIIIVKSEKSAFDDEYLDIDISKDGKNIAMLIYKATVSYTT